MNNYIVTQKDIEVLMQSDKTLYYKLELLNEDMKVLDCIEGNLISDNISINADSDIRRTYNCEMIVKDSTFNLGKNNYIWFDKLIRPYIGILHQRTQEVTWYLLGTFLYTDMNYSYDITTNSLSITCLDMMCLLNDTRNGQLDAYERIIQAGTDARTVIISLLNEVGITKYYIEFNQNEKMLSTFQIPYDLKYSAGTTAYTIIKDIVSLYAGTQMYFDLYGTFVICRIPTGENEQVVLNDEIIQPILINEQMSTSFSSIYNRIEIWGKINEPDYYSKEVTYSNGVYYCNVIVHKLDEDTGEYKELEYDSLDNFDEFSFKIPSTNANPQYININNLGNIPIHNDKGEFLPMNYLTANTDCVFRYRKESNDFLYIGQYQCHSECYLTNNINDTSENAVIDPDSEYSIEMIGDKLKVLSGSDIDKIYTNGLCLQRAHLELYNATNRQNNLNMSTIAIPFLDVNQLIEFTSNSNKNKCQYLINNISCSYANFQMSINASRYYPNYI